MSHLCNVMRASQWGNFWIWRDICWVRGMAWDSTTMMMMVRLRRSRVDVAFVRCRRSFLLRGRGVRFVLDIWSDGYRYGRLRMDWAVFPVLAGEREREAGRKHGECIRLDIPCAHDHFAPILSLHFSCASRFSLIGEKRRVPRQTPKDEQNKSLPSRGLWLYL